MTVSANAANAQVGGNTVHAEPGETVYVSIPIKHNLGLMGFKLTVTYDPAALRVEGVTAGSLTGSGMLNDSIGVTSDGTFTVLWSDTQDAKGDGTLAELAFQAQEKAEGETTVNLEYSAADTFNEKWEDIALDCTPITVVFDGETQTPQAVKQPDSRDIVSAVENTGGTDVSAVNEALRKMTGTEDAFGSEDELRSAYTKAVQEVFADSVLQVVDTDAIDEVIADALQAVGAETLETVPPKQQTAFADKVQVGLAEYADDVPDLSNLEPDAAVEAVQMLQEKNEVAKAQTVAVPDAPPQERGTRVWIWIAAGVVLIAAISVFAVYHTRKHKKHEEETK